MKRVVLELPDEIVHTYGRSSWSGKESVEVTASILKAALTTNDYHENYYFSNSDEVLIIACEHCIPHHRPKIGN